jgi:HK97 gp10 family phage protein
MKITVKVEGLRELDAALAEFPQSTGKNILRRTGRYALEPFDKAWRQKAPHLTGALEESGSVGSKLTRRQRKAVERENSVEVFAGPGPHPQATLQEFGTEHHPPQPFARPAFDETKDEVLDRVKDGLAAEIEKARKRAAKKALKALKGAG